MGIVIIAIVVGYFYAFRTGENIIWRLAGGQGDPPSFRRWEERQRRRGARTPITDRTEARRFWAHVWHDAHASAHEWRQRKHGRRWEERRRRWHAEDLKREHERALAPCVFCGADRGETCRPHCPELETPDTVPGAPRRTEPDRATSGDRTTATVPPAPDRATGTAPGDRTTTAPPEPRHASGTSRTAPPERPSADRASAPTVPSRVPAAGDRAAVAGGGPLATEPTGGIPAGKETPFADEPDSKVTRIDKNSSRTRRAGIDSTTTGGNVSTPAPYGTATPAPVGEFTGYEATVVGFNSIVQLTAALDAAYERQMANLRANHADAKTIEMVSRCREMNENHHAAAAAAGNDWVTRQGAVKETKEATGARGDQALHDN